MLFSIPCNINRRWNTIDSRKGICEMDCFAFKNAKYLGFLMELRFETPVSQMPQKRVWISS